jgi:acyl transferase domain-containing protein
VLSEHFNHTFHVYRHTEIVAFLTSLVKVIGIIKTGVIPPQVNLVTLNPAIDWDRYRLRVAREVTPLPNWSNSGQALISLASSGIGGSNGHAVIEAPPSQDHTEISSGLAGMTLLVAGGLSPRSATAIADSIAQSGLTNSSQLPLISAVFGRRSRQMTWRSYAIAESNIPVQFSQPALVPRVKPRIVFVFSGQGPQVCLISSAVFSRSYRSFYLVHWHGKAAFL